MLETAELRAPFAKEAAICSRRKAVCAEGGPSLSTCVPKSDKLKVAPRDGRSICCTPEILKLESRPRRFCFKIHYNGKKNPRCEISRSPSYRALPATSLVHARPVEPRTFQFDSLGCPVRRHLRPRAEKAGRISSNRLLQLAEVKRLPRAKNEIWYQRIPDPQQRPEGDQGS